MAHRNNIFKNSVTEFKIRVTKKGSFVWNYFGKLYQGDTDVSTNQNWCKVCLDQAVAEETQKNEENDSHDSSFAR